MQQILKPENRKKTFLALAAAILGLFVIENFTTLDIFSPVQKIVQPAQLALYKSKMDAQNLFGTVAQIGSLRGREQELSRENALLKAENEGLKRLEKENEILRGQLGVKKEAKRSALAFVIGQDPIIGSSSLLLNKGKNDGVEEGDLVFIKNVLLGEITIVDVYSSSSRLLTDSSVKVPAVTASGVKGLLQGKFGSSMILGKVVQNKKLISGETVFTSGEAGYPKNLVVGRIGKIEKDPAALFQTAEVEPIINFGELEAVFIEIER